MSRVGQNANGEPVHAPSSPVSSSLTGPQLWAAFQLAAAWMERHAAAINALNVFPVPDGDTGTNLSSTLNAATEAAPSTQIGGAGETAAAIARGALMGSRGNSGVIM